MSASRGEFLTVMHENLLDWLMTHEHDFDTLAGGPLGEALTRDELRDLVDEPTSMPRFIQHLRDEIAFHARKRWYVDGKNVTTGESWGVTVEAPDRAAALAKTLRRKAWAGWLLEGVEPCTYAFTVRPVDG